MVLRGCLLRGPPQAQLLRLAWAPNSASRIVARQFSGAGASATEQGQGQGLEHRRPWEVPIKWKRHRLEQPLKKVFERAKTNKKGEWECVVYACGEVNLKERAVCYKCKTPRPGTAAEWEEERSKNTLKGTSDWQCTRCTTRNFAFRDKCWKCNLKRQLAHGEWWCQVCSKHNYRGNTTCFACGADRRKRTRKPGELKPRGASRRKLLESKSTIQAEYRQAGDRL